MKPQQIPNCNRSFVVRGIKENKRIDGRVCSEFRDVNINFGSDFGSCVVSLGNTKVLSNVSSEIVEPKPAKPCEGLLTVFVDLSPMASPFFEGNKVSDQGVEAIRIIERTIRDSRCVDLESLCLVSHEKVWSLRVDVIVLNDEGNLLECCSIAALSSLAHYRRPEVTVDEEKIIIHSFEEKHPIPLTVFHYPFCTSFAFFSSGKIVVDPTELEEQLCAGYLTVSANSFREITTLHTSGPSRVDKAQVLKCCTLAIERSRYLTKLVRETLARDTHERSSDEIRVSFASQVKSKRSVLGICKKKLKEVDISDLHEEFKEEGEEEGEEESGEDMEEGGKKEDVDFEESS